MKVTFLPGIKSISGTFRNKHMQERIVFRHYKHDKPGEGHASIQRPQERLTPVTPEELQRRLRFKIISQEVGRRIASGDKRSKKEIWAELKRAYDNNCAETGSRLEAE